ncbi:WYL domain protein [Clostridium argentinense CDC 2741]|uniref:WYL domain protein n=1 Tax=Clostridium argentinense CDC 2741 TaxID=1418104 RepID=A0A0C1QWH4_9CLOT|nr:WYL domain-containing protein [Clostridium argentinense]KIE45342.1 WYL domain protein [Clostridium argentinense CDC 2741]NFF38446.1 WYL domain-containing protein [Clostridium argentinense]NFP49360.1 WYL domain-containing protein [Clostridium argentinense]NFP71763.1 WYL domain-containing protein [Clostridium argentinense]NFP76645.1 WYL domain-containing protein [Clostridium argentinense]
MCSAYDNKKFEATLEKLLSVSKEEKLMNPKIRFDFSLSRKGSNIDKYIRVIENAIDKEQIIEFEYTNSYGDKKIRLVEPVIVIYKWYGWYLLAYCCNKKDYRLFKVIRMRHLKLTYKPCSIKHENIDELLSKQEEQGNEKKYTS